MKIEVYVDGQGKPQHLAVPLERPAGEKTIHRSFCGANVDGMKVEESSAERVVCDNCDDQLKMYKEVMAE